jgi:membrane fusion protein (multidrug efflux system)
MRRLKQNADLSPEQQDKRKSNFELTLASGEKFGPKGHFLFVDRQVNVRTGTLTVAIEFPNPGSVLRPGQYGMVRAVLENRSGALVVPQRAVGERQGVNMVAVVGDDNKVTIKPVKTGERVGSDWIISSGLKPGDRVIAEGLMKVKAGTVVETRPYTGGKADSGASKGGDGAHATTQGENR